MKKSLVILTILLCSCASNNKETSEESTLIDLNKLNTVDDFKSCIDSIYYVYIQPINGIDFEWAYKPQIKENTIYLCDPDFTKAIYKFDMSGNLIFNLSRHGKSKTEYVEITDYCVSDDLIYVWDAASLKIIAYSNQTGEFINSFKVPEHIDRFCSMKNNVITYNGINRVTGNENRIITYDSLGTVLYQTFPVTEVDKKFTVGLLPKDIINYNNDIYFISNYDYKIYRLENDKYSVYKSFDFGKDYMVTQTYLENRFNKDGIGLYDDIQEDNFAVIGSISMIENSLFVKYSAKKTEYMYVKIGDKEFNYNFQDFIAAVQDCFLMTDDKLCNVYTKTMYAYDKSINPEIVRYFEEDENAIIPPVIKIIHLKTN